MNTIDRNKILEVVNKAIDKAEELNNDERFLALKEVYKIEDETEREEYIKDKMKDIQALIPFGDSVAQLALFILMFDGNTIKI